MASIPCRLVDNSFGPYAESCRGGFDFTLLFEESILSILPLALLITVIPFRISYLAPRSIKVDSDLLLPTKLVCEALVPHANLFKHKLELTFGLYR